MMLHGFIRSCHDNEGWGHDDNFVLGIGGLFMAGVSEPAEAIEYGLDYKQVQGHAVGQSPSGSVKGGRQTRLMLSPAL